ncbi:transglycosylase SLT domain-containing protein [Falsiroseomonas tokyonensis]|uniref:Transglycosylase SLT domain-containing protein n=1 Tax=Falsiroseomonas tokyonensis TaxID=430521 RepID=A0ABV7BNQ6_9PROT|nr:transglycosylase SLT domain-containing protein [Falsiroseomonas tokyonensis]MBU8536841.1 transglycosylase SLT domain-containing protein [Falsiroseomonas tokyonensis]
MLRLFLFTALLIGAAPAAAQPAAPPEDPWTACTRAIAAAEARSGIPDGLLLAIARVESSRARPGGGSAPWPFALNAGGESLFPETAAEAVAKVEALREAGQRSVDVGCMQVNLFYHPAAFPELEQAFHPPTNVAYAVRFLRELRGRTASWAEAVAQYHSMEPGRGLAYHQRVRVAQGTALPPAAVSGLCAPGLRARLVIPPGAGARPRLTCRR